MFKDLIGNTKNGEMLRSVFLTKKPAHAYLFYGPNGVGKYLFAVNFAKLFNCVSPTVDNEPCDKCESCVKINTGSHPDIHVVSTSTNSIKIEQIRQLHESISFKKFEAKYRFCIIRDAEKMTVEAQNSFLKILEEPYGETIFILICANKGKLLPTVISRCQKTHFGNIDDREIYEFAKSRRDDLDDRNLKIISRLAGGSLAKIEELLKEDFSQIRDHIKIITEALSSNSADKIKVALNLTKDKDKLKEVLEVLIQFFSDMICERNGLKEEIVNEAMLNSYREQFKLYSTEELCLCIEQIFDAFELIAKNVNSNLVVENLLFNLDKNELNHF